MKLVLFDIDGTILLSGGAGKRAMDRALVEVFGSSGPDNHSFGGKTDPQIVRELMRIDGHEDPHIDGRMSELLDRYLAYLNREIDADRSRVVTMPGIHELLDALELRDDVILGLLTGNLIAGAKTKLNAANIDFDRFKVGAFGSDHETRGELPAVAQRRAREELGVDVHGGDVVVIGDTPADIDCGRSIGARAIAVATGHFSVDDLRAHQPAVVFEDLSDTAAAIDAIMA
ncbi:MAG TPA: HAD hydrolase-like protein [Gemmatimonadaceae bacterium]|jgi:phosphoglycolate phosphatase-like HAD superfamily hydrolase